MNKKERPSFLALGLVALCGVSLTACEQNYGIAVNQQPPTTAVVPTGTDVVTGQGIQSAQSTESFDAAKSQTKKIDFLFVIDNSISMADNQRKLAAGFAAFADTFYRRADLDICTMIITSDRYLGRVGENGYQRERSVPCTKPAGSETWSSEQMQAHIDSLIAEFRQKAYVGANGSGVELLGKTLVSFLYNQNKSTDPLNPENRNGFFRKDAIANISFLSDENNFNYQGPDAAAENDISAEAIKVATDAYFKALNPAGEQTYSVTSLIELSLSANTIPGLAVNLDQMASTVGRESAKSDIRGDAASFTSLYHSVANAIVQRASAFTLAHAIYQGNGKEHADVRVRLRRANGMSVQLLEGRDFVVILPNQITLTQSAIAALMGGDKVEVTYRYLLNK